MTSAHSTLTLRPCSTRFLFSAEQEHDPLSALRSATCRKDKKREQAPCCEHIGTVRKLVHRKAYWTGSFLCCSGNSLRHRKLRSFCPCFKAHKFKPAKFHATGRGGNILPSYVKVFACHMRKTIRALTCPQIMSPQHVYRPLMCFVVCCCPGRHAVPD